MNDPKKAPTEKEKKMTMEEVKEQSSVVRNIATMADISRSLTKEQFDVIRNTIAPTLNDSELRVFLYRSHKLGLDPLNGEIFSYSTGEGKYRKMVVIIARDGKRVIAERRGRVSSIKTEAVYRMKVVEQPAKDGAPEKAIYKRCEPWEGGELWGATCIVARKDTEQTFTVTVPLSEYKGSTPVWTQKPETMIKKVAESQALSLAEPELSGVYDESERWDEPKNGGALSSEESSKPASAAQIENIKNLVGYEKMTAEDKDYWDSQFADMTYGQAAEKTREIALQKNKK